MIQRAILVISPMYVLTLSLVGGDFDIDIEFGHS